VRPGAGGCVDLFQQLALRLHGGEQLLDLLALLVELGLQAA
jgi:hypothetical protein